VYVLFSEFRKIHDPFPILISHFLRIPDSTNFQSLQKIEIPDLQRKQETARNNLYEINTSRKTYLMNQETKEKLHHKENTTRKKRLEQGNIRLQQGKYPYDDFMTAFQQPFQFWTLCRNSISSKLATRCLKFFAAAD
jgi:hypothetical protein